MNPSVAFICLCIVAVYSTAEKQSKSKRDISGLYTFPRTGKGDASWKSLYLGPHEEKRQGLIPFPRVGRNKDPVENGVGMWFGPRLGRYQKRKFFFNNENGAFMLDKDLPVDDKNLNFTPRLGQESSEEMDLSRDYRT